MLTKEVAYRGMYFFLERIYSLTENSELGGLLGSMSLLSDGSPADSALWSDWEEAIKRAMGEERIALIIVEENSGKNSS